MKPENFEKNRGKTVAKLKAKLDVIQVLPQLAKPSDIQAKLLNQLSKIEIFSVKKKG